MQFVDDPQAVTILAPQLASADALLDALAPLGTGDVFCAAAPEEPEDSEFVSYLPAEEFPYYSATISDTVATFVLDVERDDPSSAQTRYEVRVTDFGPGADRLRYRVAKTVLEVTGGRVYGADGVASELTAPAEDPFGKLW